MADLLTGACGGRQPRASALALAPAVRRTPVQAAGQIPRRADWPERLADLIAREQSAPFAWGRHDCATLAIAAVQAVTGADLAAGVPPWVSAAAALRSLRHAGSATAEQFFAAHLPAIPVAEAGRGDLVYAADTGPLVCPAVLAGETAHSRSETGWIVFPRRLAVRAYRVGAT